MAGVALHFGEQLHEAVEDGVGELLVKPGPAQDRACPFMHHSADHVGLRLQRAQRPADAGVENRLMPPLPHRRLQRLPDQRREVEGG